MAGRIETIILRARDTLADANGERWSDDRLLRLVDEGQKDIAKHTRLLKGQTDIIVVPGQATYSLPADLWLITRAAFDDCLIPFQTHGELDELVRTQAIENDHRYSYRERRGYGSYVPPAGSYCWETDEGPRVEAVIYDRRNLDEIRLYPIPDTSEGDQYTFETDNPEFFGAELLGVTTGITDYSLDSVFGVVTDLYDPLVEQENFFSVYGVVTEITESTGVAHLWYIKMPSDVTNMSDELEMPAMFDTALKHYVVANAFDDDYDTKFAEKAAKALGYYNRELGIAQETDAMDGVRNNQYRTDYRGAFE